MAADEANRKATRKTNDVGPTGQTVAANIARIRAMRIMSTYNLSERLEELGRPIAPSAITRIESGARKVDVDDLMVFAAALRVSPSALLLPFLPTEGAQIEITGPGAIPADAAWDWVIGDRPYDLPDEDDGQIWNDFQTYSRPHGRRNYRATTPKAAKPDPEAVAVLTKLARSRHRGDTSGASETIRPFEDPAAE